MTRRTSLPAKLLAMVALALVVALVGACSQSPEARKQKAVDRAESYLKDGKANEAIIELRNALQIDKDYVPALRALGRAYAEKAWYADTARELARAQTLAPDNTDIAIELGRAQAELGQWKDVDAQSQRILAKSPRNAMGIYLRALARLGQGKPEEALALADEAAKGEGGLPADLPPVRAEALARLGKIPEAEQAYRASLAANPKDRRSLQGLGGLELRQGKFTEAKQHYSEAQALAPHDPRVRLGLAAATASLGNVKEAVKILEGVDVRARSVAVQVALGSYYLRDNRANDAIAALGPVVAQVPQYMGARLLLATAYLAAGSPQQAIGHLEDLRRQAPEQPTVNFRLAQAYTRVGRPKDALALLDADAKRLEGAPSFQLERGRALILLGRLDEAYGAASKAQTLAPQAAPPVLLMGQIKAQQGDTKAAQDLFTKAAQMDQGSVPARIMLGRLRASEQDLEGALSEFDAAVRTDPTSVVAARTKAAALIQQKRTREAVQFLEGAVKAESAVPGLHGLLAEAYATDNQIDKARAAFQKQLDLDPKSLEARMGLARIALRQQKDDEALGYLQAVVKTNPDHLPALLLLGGVSERLGRYDQAIGPLAAAVKSNPAQPSLALALASLRQQTGEYDAIIADMSELLRRYPEFNAARVMRAQAYLAKRDAAGGLQDLTEAARVNPKDAGVQLLLARAYAVMGRVPEAQAAYRQALKLNPNLEPAQRELALIEGGKRDPQVAAKRIQELRSLVQRDPRNVQYREALARALLSSGQLKEGEAELKALLDTAPGHVGGNLLMADLRIRQKRVDEAVPHLRTALRTNPNSLEANVALARYLRSQGRREEALPFYEAALRINSALPDLKLELGIIYAEMGRLNDALRLAQELEKSVPKSPVPPTLRGQVLLAQGNVKGAEAAFTDAVALGGNVGAAHRGLGQALASQGQPDRAIEQYRKALAKNENDVITLNNLAWLLVDAKKQPDQALPLATKAAQLAPRSPEVADTLGWVQYQRGAYAEAEKALSFAEQQAPSNGQIKYHLGLTYAKLGKKGDAVSSLRRAAQIDPKLAQSEKISDLIKELGG